MLKGGVATWTAIRLVAPRDRGGSTTGYPGSIDTISVRAMTITDVVAVAMAITDEVAVADAVIWIATPQVAPGADRLKTARQPLGPVFS
jgi:hypothetical protein